MVFGGSNSSHLSLKINYIAVIMLFYLMCRLYKRNCSVFVVLSHLFVFKFVKTYETIFGKHFCVTYETLEIHHKHFSLTLKTLVFFFINFLICFFHKTPSSQAFNHIPEIMSRGFLYLQ